MNVLIIFSSQCSQFLLLNYISGVRVVEKFLGILQFVVKESDVSFRKFIDSTLALCLDYIYPLGKSNFYFDIISLDGNCLKVR